MAFDESSGLESGSISQINVTPLVDVMLVLLVIFMVTSPILQQGVELELPKESIEAVEGDGEQVVVSVTKEGKVFIGKDNSVQLSNLGSRVKEILSRKKEKQIFIRADRRVEYGKVMSVMAELRRSGIYNVGLITEPS